MSDQIKEYHFSRPPTEAEMMAVPVDVWIAYIREYEDRTGKFTGMKNRRDVRGSFIWMHLMSISKPDGPHPVLYDYQISVLRKLINHYKDVK